MRVLTSCELDPGAAIRIVRLHRQDAMNDTTTQNNPTACDTMSSEIRAEFDALVSEPKFGPVAAAAFKSWCSGAAKPRTGSPGVSAPESIFIAHSDDKGCCLIGAAVVGQKSIHEDGSYENAYDAAHRIFGLDAGPNRDSDLDSRPEITGLWKGFDNYRGSVFPSDSAAAFKFGRRVHALAEKIFGRF